jgi:hypothetical protein
MRKRIADNRIIELVRIMLKCGIMTDTYHDATIGTPQGGVLSPLLANIYLNEFDQWWHREFQDLTRHQRAVRRKNGQGLAILYRYADDFVMLWNGDRRGAFEYKERIKQFLWDNLRLELSDEKTKVTNIRSGTIEFLGFQIFRRPARTRKGEVNIIRPSRKSVVRIRESIKNLLSTQTYYVTAEQVIGKLNQMINGWTNYYKYVNAKDTFAYLDWWMWHRFIHWMRRRTKLGLWRVFREYARENTFVVNGVRLRNFFQTRILKARIMHKRIEHPYMLPYRPEYQADDPFIGETEKIRSSPAYGRSYPENRRRALERDNFQCQKYAGKKNLITHHINPIPSRLKQARRWKSVDRYHEVDNLATLCRSCHEQVHGMSPNQFQRWIAS